MRTLSRLWMAAVATMLMAGAVFAGPIPSSPGPPFPSFGESDLASFITPGNVVRVDWIVMDASTFGFPGLFAYLYQVENVSGVYIDTFTVTFPAGVVPAVEVVAFGVLAGDDLDVATTFHPAHSPPNIFGELSELPLGNAPSSTSVNVVGGFVTDITWTWTSTDQGGFGLLAPNTQSPTLYFITSFPPVYGVGAASNATPPSPWNSLAPGGQPIPVPSPEPTTALLLIGALMVGASVCRRRMTK
jgi:hypothetical protein